MVPVAGRIFELESPETTDNKGLPAVTLADPLGDVHGWTDRAI